MRHDRPPIAGRIAAAALVACILATFVAYAADAPPAPPVWVAARVAEAPVVGTPQTAAETASSRATAAAPAVTVVPPALTRPAAIPAAPVLPATTATRAAPAPAPAANAAHAAVAPAATGGRTVSSWGLQSLSCMAVGAIASVGVFVYSNTIAAAVTGGPNPALVVPLMAAGYAVGCTVGATVSPSLRWITGHPS